MKCRYKESCGHEFCPEDECPEYDAAVETNADYIRAMSDEELADFINNHNICGLRTNEECNISYCGVCGQCVLDWLQQPAEQAVAAPDEDKQYSGLLED